MNLGTQKNKMNLIKSKNVAIFCSRQTMFISRNDLWVKNCGMAVKWIKKSGHVLLSSSGMSTWDLLTFLGQYYKVPMILYIPAYDMVDYKSRKEKIIKDFELDNNLVSFYPVFPDSEISDKKYFYKKRDDIISATAEILIPISHRIGGNVSNIISKHKKECKDINFDFQTKYNNKRKVPLYKFTHPNINSEVLGFDENYFIHWTRTFNKCWPGESRFKYYLDIISHDNYPRTAFDTLDRIVNNKKILASPNHMPRNISTVSFSASAPADIIPMIRWRARFSQFSFEPYGIGFKKEIALKQNVQPVIYYHKHLPVKLSSDQIYLAQSIGIITDWRHEKEWRHKTDFDFSKISKKDLILFCYTKAEATKLENKFGIRTISFLK